ncbi:MAG: hypothetical protein KDD56_09295 [Bdellovibrionales bacterium]|nr:hypothetical protein [Bdellovibrionales bacterium]
MSKIILHSAIHWEAAPIIKHLNLKKNLNFKSFEVFSNNDFVYVISGIGKIKAACALARVLETSSGLDSAALLNIGVAGSKAGSYPVGTLLRIISCKDTASNRSYYPDAILNLGIPEESLETHDKAVSNDSEPLLNYPIVDMELSGVLEAGSQFFTWDKIFSLKIVSDLLQVACLNKNFVHSLVEQNLPSIEEAFKKIFIYLDSQTKILSADSLSLIQNLSEQIKLTSYQQIMLEDAVKGAEAKGLPWKSRIKAFLNVNPENKEQVKVLLNEVCNAISLS